MSPQPRRRHAVSASKATPGETLEATFQAQVIGLARYTQWLIYHAPAGGKDGRADREQVGAGFPDLVLVKGPRLIFVELKTRTGRVRPDQVTWLDALGDVGRLALGPASVEVYLWRPADLEDIARILAAGAGDHVIDEARNYARNLT